MSYLESLKKDGVVLVKDAWPEDEIKKISADYNKIDLSLKNKDIPKDKPIIVFWKHVVGEQKRICTFDEFPSIWKFINNRIVPKVREILGDDKAYLHLLETIVFNKPYETSNTLHWHQDVAYFPMKPNNQIAIWFPLEPVDREAGALNYAIGSHKEGIKGSTDLHTRKPFEGEDRNLIPEDPAKEGYEVRCMEMSNVDMVCHNGYTWHYSGPNKKKRICKKRSFCKIYYRKSLF